MLTIPSDRRRVQAPRQRFCRAPAHGFPSDCSHHLTASRHVAGMGADSSCRLWAGLLELSMSRKMPSGGRRVCTGSIQVPDSSVSTARFALPASHSVSNRPSDGSRPPADRGPSGRRWRASPNHERAARRPPGAAAPADGAACSCDAAPHRGLKHPSESGQTLRPARDTRAAHRPTPAGHAGVSKAWLPSPSLLPSPSEPVLVAFR